MEYKPKSAQWFIDRIGKRIYRDYHPCCHHCDEVAMAGLVVHDEQHAYYLAATDSDFAMEGTFLNYRDTK